MFRRQLCSLHLGACAMAAAALICGSVGRARAEPPVNLPPVPTTIDGKPAHHVAVDTPLHMYATPTARASSTIYLERCKGGCPIKIGTNDARSNSSSIPDPRKITNPVVTEFAASEGGDADAEWAAVVQCMKEVYSPYAVTITDVKPTDGTPYHEAIVAGQPEDLALAGDILGIAPLAADCSAIDNVISFSFANAHSPAKSAQATERVQNICWTAAQESAHAFGLDHEYSFPNDRSACNDPMTYRTDCGGQKFFRNEVATCGEYAARTCKCGGTQNSHLKILSVFGAGTPITGLPEVSVTDPKVDATVLGTTVSVTAGATRGVSRVEVYFNGYKWAEKEGAAFRDNGQPDPSPYTVLVPSALPNSIVDVKAIAFDDLGAAGESTTVTVTRGAPCASADTCAKGQKCEAGKCFWDPPTAEVGDTCAYPQFCKSGLCRGTADQQICTQNCIPGSADSCPSGLTCIAETANQGVCFFEDSGGCCSTSDTGARWWIHGGIAALVIAIATRRRRR